ncbi:MAG: hypothetical protein JNK78_11020 [Planctomycetes bacterium]|nr:hypothetical protein [Planctomycetota bacterium]
MRCVAGSVLLILIGSLSAQQGANEAAEDVAKRVLSGGWFEEARSRRSGDGVLERWTTAHTGDPERGEFLPLVSFEQPMRTIGSIGLAGWLSLVCHGDGDLLAMTDVAFHFGALGIDPSDVGLRQWLALTPPSFEGELGRAELFDRLLAIDHLVARRVRGASAECAAIAANDALPALLRDRAANAQRTLRGDTTAPAPARRRLDPATVELPQAFDACIAIDHARLPDLRWVTALGRRVGAAVSARAFEAAGGRTSASQCSGVQLHCDAVSEAPFRVAHHFGNLRFDHSILTFVAKAPARRSDPPFAVVWQAVGDFEGERWGGVPRELQISDVLPLTVEVEPHALRAASDKGRGKARPEVATPLLLDDGVALRISLPATSKVWTGLAMQKVPAVKSGEIRVTFGDPGVVVGALQGPAPHDAAGGGE